VSWLVVPDAFETQHHRKTNDDSNQGNSTEKLYQRQRLLRDKMKLLSHLYSYIDSIASSSIAEGDQREQRGHSPLCHSVTRTCDENGCSIGFNEAILSDNLPLQEARMTQHSIRMKSLMPL